MTADQAVRLLEQKADEKHREGLLRYGIPNKQAIGVKLPEIRKIAKQIGIHQPLAEELWKIPYHEAKHLAIALADPKQIAKETLEHWTKGIYSWDLCDHLSGVTARTNYREEVIEEWISSEDEFVKRSAIVTLVAIVIHDKKRSNEQIIPYLRIVEREAWDDRNFIKKAVNWLLRTIGKKNLKLNQEAITCAKHLLAHPDASAHWIAKDALRELERPTIQERLIAKEKKAKK